jgi:methionyl-tRNA formyltransferase
VEKEPGRGGLILKILFWGTPLFALPSLRALSEEGHEMVGVVTQPDRPSGRGRKLTPSPVRRVAEEEGIPVLTPEKPRGEEFMDAIRALDPEVSVVVAYGHILPGEVLDAPPRGSLNLHASLLPKLRGAAPVHWAILRGYETTGVTVMRMVEAMDAGPILYQTPEKIGAEETATELSTRLSETGAEALVEAMALLAEDSTQEVEQEHAQATYAPKVDRKMARVDWDRGAEELGWHLRGLDDFPGAWSTLDSDPVKLFGPRAEPRYSHGAAPGTVLRASADEGLLVACGVGALEVGEIQPSGKRRMAASAWLQGHRVGSEARFV